MKKKILAALVAVGTVVIGGVAMAGASAPPPDPTPTTAATPTTIADSEIFGTGPSGDQDFSIPDCPVNSYWNGHVANDASSCSPTSSPAPQGTEALPTDGAGCSVPESEDLEFLPDGSPRYTQSSQMRDLIVCVLPEILDWVTFEYQGSLTPPPEWESLSGSLAPNNFLWVPTASAATFDTTNSCSSDDPENIFGYCDKDGNIYMGETTAWIFYHGSEDYGMLAGGDAALIAAIGHEVGHRIQHVANALAVDQKNDPHAEIPRENMSDCFSGALMAYAGRLGLLDTSATAITNPEGTIVDASGGDDMDDMINGVKNIADIEYGGRSHGTMDQRIRAFFVGYDADPDLGAWACDFYFSDISIIPLDADATTTTTSGPQASNVVVAGSGTTTVAQAGPTTTVAPVPAPAATLPLPTGSTDGALNGFAQQCLAGDMNACDSLWNNVTDADAVVIPELEAYELFADSCAGRQEQNTGKYCADVFVSTSGATVTTVAGSVTTTATAPGPTTTVAPVPAPAPTLPLPTGSDSTYNHLAQQCLAGDMSKCDELWVTVNAASSTTPGLEEYLVFGDTCAGRQAEHTGLTCETVFISVAPAPVTTLAPGTTVTTAPVTTTAAATVTTAAAVSGEALTSHDALDYCATSVVPGEFADREATEVATEEVGSIAAEASTNGQTQDQLVTQLVQDMWGANTNKVIVVNPFDGRTDTTKANALGEVVGLSLICMAQVLEMPQDVIDNYTSTNAGQDTWVDSTGTLNYKMDWSLQDNLDSGVKDFVVFIYDVPA